MDSGYRPSELVSGPQADLARENERLRLESRMLREEREILKTDLKILAHIREHYALSNGSYGRPRMIMELREAGLDVGERRVGRFMKDNGIRPVSTRRHKVTTDSQHQSGIVANFLDGDFLAEGPNRKWAGDISYIWTAEGWLYLAVVIDLFSRRVIGCAASGRMKKGSGHPCPGYSGAVA